MPDQLSKNLTQEQSLKHQTIMAELDRWVHAHGNGQYGPANYQPLGKLALYPDYGIQQVRDEISEFTEELLKRNYSGTILEVGIGYYGSTHFLWRQLFKKVITIEKSPERCRDFSLRFSKFTGGTWPSENGRSGFIFGMSSEPQAVQKAYDAIGRNLGVLFIDGDHSYQAVLTDWLLYHNLVRPGGIVAFHDCATNIIEQSGAPKFLAKLEKGEIDGKKYLLHKIIHSQHVGIAYYECL